MGFFSILLLALGLSMDALAASVASTKRIAGGPLRRALSLGVVFGLFQAAMPLLGYGIGAKLGPLAQRWDHWIAFVLLAGIGGKMLFDAIRGGDEAEDGAPSERASLVVLLALGLATSIDAFAVGITLPMLHAPFVLSIVTIGVTTFVLSAAGSLAAKRVTSAKAFEVLGGLVLVGLGGKILVEHLTKGI